ncbi:MAG: hypothetical protein IIX15_04280 [Clostridia bacterium]|nr:hypothetical protein [Clostridia bacterium]
MPHVQKYASSAAAKRQAHCSLSSVPASLRHQNIRKKAFRAEARNAFFSFYRAFADYLYLSFFLANEMNTPATAPMLTTPMAANIMVLGSSFFSGSSGSLGPSGSFGVSGVPGSSGLLGLLGSSGFSGVSGSSGLLGVAGSSGVSEGSS